MHAQRGLAITSMLETDDNPARSSDYIYTGADHNPARSSQVIER